MSRGGPSTFPNCLSQPYITLTLEQPNVQQEEIRKRLRQTETDLSWPRTQHWYKYPPFSSVSPAYASPLARVYSARKNTNHASPTAPIDLLLFESLCRSLNAKILLPLAFCSPFNNLRECALTPTQASQRAATRVPLELLPADFPLLPPLWF